MSKYAPPKGKMVAAGEYELHYLTYGDGPAVVFLHGSGPGASAYSNFKHNIDAVVNAGHQAILIDMVGFGYSSKPEGLDYTTELFSSTVKAALDSIGVTECTLVGNSLGGAICIHLALNYPKMVQRLVMMAPGGIEERETYFAMPGITKMVGAFVDGGLDRTGLRSVLETLVFDPKWVTDELIEERFCILETQPTDVLGRMVIPSMGDQLDKLECPIYGFWGQQDQMTPASGSTKFLEQSDDCQFLMLANCGHWVMVEHQTVFNNMLSGVLTSS